MEKIYMDGNKKNKKQSFFQKLFNDKGSMTATIVVAIVGIFGLVAFGFSQISFAVEEVNLTGSALPESFTSSQGEPSVTQLRGTTYDGVDGILPIIGFYAQLADNSTIPVFCIEYDITYKTGETYTKGSQITDNGLIYLMSQLYPNKAISDASGNEFDSTVDQDVYIQTWLTQSAIWLYLYETEDPNNQTLNSTPEEAVMYYADNLRKVSRLYNNNMDYVVDTGSNVGLYDVYGSMSNTGEHYTINELIEQAKSYKNKGGVSLSVEPKTDTIAITNDNKYYQSDLVSVVGETNIPLESYESYSVTLKNAPEGTILVDENGNVYDDITNMSPTAKFYVRVPVDKITDATKNVEINVRGNFKIYGANAYISDEYQKVANVGLFNRSIDEPLSIQFDYTPRVPDTGMSVVQKIYFVGLIILLSGVGIIYVNAKPEKNK